jgi:hypothetical protein
MSVSDEINNFIEKEGCGSARDALNVALAKLKDAEAHARVLCDEIAVLRTRVADLEDACYRRREYV